MWRLLILLGVAAALGACSGGNSLSQGANERVTAQAVPTPNDDQTRKVLQDALLTRFEMPPDWHSMDVQQVGNQIWSGPCDSPPRLTSPTFVVSAGDGFGRRIDSRDFTPTVFQSIYAFPPGDAAKLLDTYRRNADTECKSRLGDATYTIERPDQPTLADESLAIRYVNTRATCGAITHELVLVRIRDDVILVESNNACDATVDVLAQTLAKELVDRLRDARQRYELSLSPTPEDTRYDGLAFALLSVQDLPRGWSTTLRGEQELVGYAFCGDKVDRGRFRASTMVTFHRLQTAVDSDPENELERLVAAPEVGQALAFLRDGSVDDYAADWLDSAESCARYYATTPRVPMSLVRVSVPQVGDGTIAYQESGFFDRSIKVLLRRGRFVMQITVRTQDPDEPDRVLLDELLRRADEKLAQNETDLLREFN
ncbi:MAG: hypothetical protein HY874_05650 [Chloroflexi bacterium]|nr:hypothetical protein [Chloroflexota bacterium]